MVATAGIKCYCCLVKESLNAEKVSWQILQIEFGTKMHQETGGQADRRTGGQTDKRFVFENSRVDSKLIYIPYYFNTSGE